MCKTVYIEVAGKEYPMRFSIAAAKAISEKFGSLDNLSEALSGAGEAETLDNVLWVVALLIQQGCAYKNLFEKDQPVPENAPVEKGKYVALDKEQLEVGLDILSLRDLQGKIYQTVGTGQQQTVETQTDEKN